MITTGVIKNINKSGISVALFEAGSSCGSGNCASCKGSKKTFTVLNTKELPVEPGSFIEMELSTAKTFFAAIRVIIIPLLLFIAGFIITGSVLGKSEGLQVAGGFAGLSIGFLFNLLVSKKYKLKEMPEIVKIL